MNIDLEYISIDKATIEELKKIPSLSISELEENTKILIIKLNNEIAAARTYKENYPFTNKFFFADHIKEEELKKVPFLSISELEENTKILIIKINDQIAAVKAYKESYPFTKKFFFVDHIKEDEILKSEIRNIFYNATRFKGLDLTSDAIRKKLEELKQELIEDTNLQPANSNQSLEISQDINLISEKIKWLEFLLECKIKQEAEKQRMKGSQEGRRH